MRIAILGPLLVEDGVSRLDVTGRRVRHLLIPLALTPKTPVPAERLIADPWPEPGTAAGITRGAAATEPADPANALQSLVSRLRRMVPVESSAAGARRRA